MEVEMSNKEEEKSKADRMLAHAEALKDELETKVQRAIGQEDELRKLKFKPIEPPSFSGKLSEWPKFRRGFENMIVFNTHLPEAEKMSLLINAVSGEPRRTLEMMQSPNGSFMQNWTLLVKTYQNNKKIALDILQGLIDIPKMASNSAEGIRRIHSTIESCLQAFEELHIDTSSWDLWILDRVSKSLDYDSRRLFEESLEDEENVPSRTVTLNFLIKRQRVLESISGSNNPHRPNKWANSAGGATQKSSCSFCGQGHRNFECSDFKKLSVDKRLEIVKEKKLCLNCLSHTYSRDKPCSSKRTCATCGKGHHTLVHRDTKKSLKSMLTLLNDKDRLLGTARIQISNGNGKWKEARAIIDPCSTHTFITHKLANQLKLKREDTHVSLNGVDGLNGETSKRGFITIKDKKGKLMQTDAYLLENICGQVPEAPLKIQLPEEWKLKEGDLADSKFNTPSYPDILLGVEIFGDMIQEGVQRRQVTRRQLRPP